VNEALKIQRVPMYVSYVYIFVRAWKAGLVQHAVSTTPPPISTVRHEIPEIQIA